MIIRIFLIHIQSPSFKKQSTDKYSTNFYSELNSPSRHLNLVIGYVDFAFQLKPSKNLANQLMQKLSTEMSLVLFV